MERFKVSVYGADRLKGFKPCREYEVEAATGEEATKRVMDDLELEKSRWWVGSVAQRVEETEW